MTTWAQFLAEIRTDIRDDSATPRWSDALLLLYVRDALRDYSSYVPRIVLREELSVVEGVTPLPAELLDIIYVESPQDTYLLERSPQPGTRVPAGLSKRYYYRQGAQLILWGASSEDPVWLTYAANHLVPASTAETTFEMTFPDMDAEIIRLYVKAKVYEQMRSRQSALDRFKNRNQGGTSTRQDNPLEPEVANLMEDYYAKISERVGGTGFYLQVRNRRNR
nr:hypothetical protein [Anaerolineae bacterium]